MGNMDEELESSYDVIVIGTGFVESLVAAACSRIGKKVLHLDSNDYYGGQWASFSLKNFESWLKDSSNQNFELAMPSLQTGESLEKLLEPNQGYSNAKCNWNESCQTAENDEGKDTISTKEKLYEQNRKFNIDLFPKVLFCRGPLVELLISSNIARYLEFKCVTRILTWMKGEDDDTAKLYNVPCSRSDVYTTEVVSLIEKRLLMKFLELCYSLEKNEALWEEYKETSFKEFLLLHKLTPRLIHFVTSAIAMVNEDASCKEGLERTSYFIKNLGRYGDMPFLFPLYGSGEMAQAFCRLCAVFEGVYMLRRSIDAIILKSQKEAIGIASEGRRFECNYCVVNSSYMPEKMTSYPKSNTISRAVLITDRSIFPSEKECLTIIRIPINSDNSTTVNCLEIGTGTGVCPPNTYLVHLTAVGCNAEDDFKPTVEKLFGGDDKPTVLFASYFNLIDSSNVTRSEDCPKNVMLCPGPDTMLDYDSSIEQAKKIFKEMFPGDEFLPRAPDPDEIILEGEDAES